MLKLHVSEKLQQFARRGGRLCLCHLFPYIRLDFYFLEIIGNFRTEHFIERKSICDAKKYTSYPPKDFSGSHHKRKQQIDIYIWFVLCIN